MTVDHWYMLAEEAHRCGIQVSDEEVGIWLENQEGQGLGADYLDALRRQSGITSADIRRAVRTHLAIWKHWRRVSGTATPSEQQVQHYVRDTQDKVRVRLVTLGAGSFVDEEEPLTEEALQAQFEKYKGAQATESESRFGYSYPQRVKLQYLVASVPEIEPQIPVTFEEAKTHWRKNRKKYTKIEFIEVPEPTTSPATTSPAATTGPATTQQAKTKRVRRPVEKAFSEARPDVEREIRQQKAIQLAEQAMRRAALELLLPWEDLKVDPTTGFKPIPPEVRDPDYLNSVCDHISKEFGIPLQYAETPLSTKQDLASIQALKNMTAEREEEGQRKLVDCAFRVPAFVETTAGDDAGLHLQFYQTPDGPFKAITFQRIGSKSVRSMALGLFRVIEARDAEPPDDLAEVRADVERDLRLTRAFDGIEPAAKELCVVASHLGMESAWALFDDLREKRGVTRMTSPAPFARQVSLGSDSFTFWQTLYSDKPTLTPPSIPGVGKSEKFVDACFEMAEEGWQTPVLDVPQTPRLQAATTQPAASPVPLVRLLPIPKLNKWFVIELLGTQDVAQAAFDSGLRRTAFRDLQREQLVKLQVSWFKPANIEARCGFERIRATPTADAEEGIGPVEEPEEEDA
jgi:hypothetical protein